MEKKRINYNYAGNMDVDAWRSRMVHQRTKRFFRQRDEAFARAHYGDSDEQLRAYLREWSRGLGRMPLPIEVPGGRYLQQRLGDWRALARAIGYAPAPHSRETETAVYRAEYARQELLFRQERKQIKAERARRSAEREAAAAKTGVERKNNASPENTASLRSNTKQEEAK